MGGIAALGGLGGVPAVFKSGGTAADWWDPAGEGLCVWSAYQPKGAASYAASKVDLSGNGNDCVDGGAFPTWDVVNGWIFDSDVAADTLNTAFVPASDQSQSVLVQFTVGDAAARQMCGLSDTGAKDFQIGPDGNFGQVTYSNGGGISVAPKLANGNLGIAGNRGYRNGVAEGAAMGGWAGATGKPIWIGALATSGASQWWGRIQAFVIYDCTLTAAQMLAVATAMALL